MNLFFRLFWILLFSRFRQPCDSLGPCLTPYRVWPTDLDVIGHVNNGKYFSMLDLARLDLMIRCNLWRKVRKQNWYPVVIAESMRFKRSLTLLQRFSIRTQVIAWNDKDIYLLQDFIYQQEIVAQGLIKARFLKKGGGTVIPQEVLELQAVPAAISKELPDWIKQWDESCARLHDSSGNIL